MEGGAVLGERVIEFREGLDARTNSLLDDFDCMRFLRARQMDVDKAVEMATAWGEWAHTVLPGSAAGRTPLNILDDLVDPNEEIYTRLCPHSLSGVDKGGRPIYWEKTGKCSVIYRELRKDLSNEDLFARHVRIQEMMLCRTRYTLAEKGERVEKMVVVDDMGDLQMSPDLDAIKYVIGILGIDQKYYPERLHAIYCINCPWYFTAIYALITPFMDPVTKAKFRLLGSDYQAALLEAMDEDQIPTDYGGTREVQWHWPYPEGSGCSPSELAVHRRQIVPESGADSKDPDAPIESGLDDIIS
jgi:hypothetical protein